MRIDLHLILQQTLRVAHADEHVGLQFMNLVLRRRVLPGLLRLVEVLDSQRLIEYVVRAHLLADQVLHHQLVERSVRGGDLFQVFGYLGAKLLFFNPCFPAFWLYLLVNFALLHLHDV